MHRQRAVRGRRARRCWCRSSSAPPRTSATTPRCWRGAARRAPAADRVDAAVAARPARRPATATRCCRWRQKARALARPQAAARVADEIEERGDEAEGGARCRCRRKAARMKHAVKHIHFVGIGGTGMSGIAEILHNLGYTVSRLRPARTAPPAPAGAAGHPRRSSATTRANIAGAEAVVTSTAVQGRQPRGDGGARQARAGRAARGDAGRADAAEAAASRSPARTARRRRPSWSPACWPKPGSTRPS